MQRMISKVICDFDKDGLLIQFGSADRLGLPVVNDIDHVWELAVRQERNIRKFSAEKGVRQRLTPLTRAPVRT